MPDKRTHRGPHPNDAKLFCAETVELLQQAAADYSLMLTKGYAEKSALKLVGDKFSLTQRQRLAIMRSACSDQQLEHRSKHRIEIDEVAGRPVAIDAYNVLITIEAAVSGSFIFKGRDGCYRDLASIHGTYRKVTETIPAIELIGSFLREKDIPEVLWLLDSPVSNSGRLKTLMAQIAEDNDYNWDIRLLHSPDAELKKTTLVVASSDSAILDVCKKWVNLAAVIIEQKLPQANVIELA